MRSLLFIAAVLLVLSTPVFADEVVMKNGERFVGKVLSLTDGSLKFKSDNAGDLTLALDQIAALTTEEPIKIRFKDGTLFDKPVRSVGDGKIEVVTSPEETPVRYPIAETDSINKPRAKWTGAISAGAIIKRGNTHDQSATVNAEAARRTEVDRMRFKAGYYGDREKDKETHESKTTDRIVYGGVQYDYFFLEKLYSYINSRFERDAEAELDLRFVGGVGGGYQWFEREDFNLMTEAGLSWISEDYTDDTDTASFFAGRLFYSVDKSLNSSVRIFNSTEWNPPFEGEGGHLVNVEGGLRSSLLANMFAEAKVVWSYDSDPADDADDRRDVRYLFSFGWNF